MKRIIGLSGFIIFCNLVHASQENFEGFIPNEYFSESTVHRASKPTRKGIPWPIWLTLKDIAKISTNRKIIIKSPPSSVKYANVIRSHLEHDLNIQKNKIETQINDEGEGGVSLFSIPEEKETIKPPFKKTERKKTISDKTLSAPSIRIQSKKENIASQLRYEEKVNNMFTALRPSISMQWYFLTSAQNEELRANWLGVRAHADLVMYRGRKFELGADNTFFTSILPLKSSIDNDTSVTRFSTIGYVKHKFEPSIFGLLNAKLGFGYFGNWRISETQKDLLPMMRGPHLEVNISTSFDEQLRIGVLAGYTYTYAGVIHGGGEIKHRIFDASNHPWFAQIGLVMNVARVKEQGIILREYWSSVHIGLSGSL